MKTARRNNSPRVRILRRVVWGVVGLTVAGWLGLKLVPIPAALQRPPQESAEFVDRDGQTLRERSVGDHFVRRVTFAELPDRLVRAFLAAEDKRFFDHAGVDWIATGRAARDGLAKGRIVSGASTITQQLVKISRPRARTFATKTIEAVTALRLEQLWSKPRILEEYVSRVDFGHMNIGVAAAADYYFGKPLRDLTDAEAAFLAGLPKNPRRLNPHRSLVAAQARQRTVLRRMLANAWLSEAAYAQAIAEPLKLRPARREFAAPHFVDLALREADDLASRVRTTLDLDLNRFIEARLREQIAPLRDKRVSNGAAVVIENATGSVLALVGSEDYFSPGAGQVNGAWAPRSAGSTIKPFTYLLALERGATAATVYADVPTEFATPTGAVRIENYSRRCAGPVSMRRSLACSLNIPAVRALESVGGPATLYQRLKDVGVTSLDRAPAEYGLGLTIGNAEVRLLELANAYACLARLGEFRPWRIFADEPPATPRQVADSRACWLVAHMLSDNDARIPAFGAESPLRFDFPVACKTGTSTDYRDNWAMAYTPEFTVGVWVGNFDGEAMRGVSGVSGAAPLMHKIVEHLHSRNGTTWYATPPNLVRAHVEPLTGHLIDSQRRGSVEEIFLAEKLPPKESSAEYDQHGNLQLGAVYAEWLASSSAPLADRATAQEEFRIVSPAPGTTYVIDPDLPGSDRARLVGAGSSNIEWRSDTLHFSAAGTEARLPLSEGEHRVWALDRATGRRVETWIRVKAL